MIANLEPDTKSSVTGDLMLGVSLGKSEVVHELKLVIASETGVDQIEILEASRLYHDFGIAGDDIGDILQVIADRWGTDFSKFEINKYSPDEQGIGNPFRMITAFFSCVRTQYRPLTVGRLADAILKGEWTEDSYLPNQVSDT